MSERSYHGATSRSLMAYEWSLNKPSFIYVLSTHAGYYFIIFLVIYTV